MSVRFDDVLAQELFQLAGKQRVLNIGCGHDTNPEFVNVDIAQLPGVDVVCSLGKVGLGFADNTFDVVVCRDVLEHVSKIESMREMHRVLKPGGKLVLSTVHFTSRDVWLDPTHLHAFSVHTFDFFSNDGRGDDRNYYFDFHFTAVEQSLIQFRASLGKGKWFIWDRLVEPIVNMRRATKDIYELTFLSRLFPAANVIAVLKK